ncbi:MAG: hypothetical protein ACXVAX_05840 [Pseudobdellovibrio sp.]
MIAKVIVLLLFLIACQAERKNDPFLDALEKIDQGQYSQAIQKLEVLRSNNPSASVTMALASAYAGRAGIETRDFLNFAAALEGNPLTNAHLEELDSYKRNQANVAVLTPLLPVATQQQLTDFFLSWAALEVYREKLAIYPYASSEKRPDLESAVSVLSESAEPGAKLYQATLLAVLVRSETDDGFDIWNSLGNPFTEILATPLDFQRIFCQPRIGGFTGWMDRQLSHVQYISQDLTLAFPSKSNEFEMFSAPLAPYRAKIPVINAALIPAGCPNAS